LNLSDPTTCTSHIVPGHTTYEDGRDRVCRNVCT